METILMCNPLWFNVKYDINPWMTNNIGTVDKKKADSQWQALKTAIEKTSVVAEIQPQQDLPDMVFTANAALVHEKISIISNFAKKERQEESIYWKNWFKIFDYDVHNIDTHFEGAGDALFDHNDTLWMGYGWRTDLKSQEYLSKFFKVNVLKLVDSNFYHLDTCFMPMSDGSVMYYPAAFDENSNDLIKKHYGKSVIAVDDEDANNFACNAVEIDGRILVNTISENLQAILTNRGWKVECLPMNEFIKSGGSCKCLTLKV
jgi:N-dimethylarginine dimethylaminohydrolase